MNAQQPTGGVIYVDKAAAGIENGRAEAPFHTVSHALSGYSAPDGIQIAIKGANYPESLTFSNKMQVLSWDGNMVTLGQ